MAQSYFITILVLSVLIAMALADGDKCNCANAGEQSPVCGTDGNTYYNREVLKCHKECSKPNLRIASRRACQCICPNTAERLPVCASNGKTYYNPQAVKCHNQCHNDNIRVTAALPCRGDTEERKL